MEKVVIITGANSGIGLATARLFKQKGYKVYGVARREFLGDECIFYQGDVNDSQRMAEIFADVYRREGRIDCLVNNAGFGIAGAIEDASKQAIESIVQTNFIALADICRQIIPYLKGDVKDTGKIINISSVGGIMPLPYQAIYSATKSAVEVFSRALDNEVRDYGVRVSAVLPGDTKTGFTQARIKEENKDGRSFDAMNRSISKMEKDEKNGKSPDSVAKVVYKIAKKRNPPLRVSVGFTSKAEVFLSRLLSVRLLNNILKKMYG